MDEQVELAKKDVDGGKILSMIKSGFMPKQRED